MSCETTREKLYELVFDLLDEDERREIQAHLESCAGCREAYQRALREHGLLKHWAVPPVPDGLAERAVAAAGATSRSKKEPAMTYEPIEPEMRWLGGRRFCLAAAAALMLVVTGVGVNSLRVASRHATPQEAVVLGQWSITPGVPTAYRVFVLNGITSAPIAEASVKAGLITAEGRTIWRGKATTDSQGIAEITPDLPPDLPEGDYKLEVMTSSDEGRSGISRSVTVKRSFRVMVTTDKPLYQPGQVMHIRTLSLATADLRPVGGRDTVIDVQDAKGNKVFKKKEQTSEFGIASAHFELADQVNTGSYTVSATVGDTTSERSVTVERYTLPKFRIDLTVDKGFYEPGATLKGDLSAQYTFGKPVAGGKVHIVASEYVETFRPFATAEGETDAEGQFHFEIPLKEQFVGQELKQGDAFVSLEATVTDTADHTQQKTLEATVTSRPIRIDVLPESGALVQNIENILYIVTAYPDGRPARTKLTIGATNQVAQTSEMGIAKVKITPTGPNLKLTILAEDERGVQAQVSRELRVGERTDAFLLRTDRAVYRTGETANLTVLSAARSGRVFLDVVKDRRTMLMKAIDVQDGRGELALDLPPDVFGTLELHAYRILRDGNIIGDTKVVQVNRADDLKITAELDKETYRPAEKALLQFIVSRADGEPAQAALGLAGVDEAVFALSEMRPGLERVYFMLQEEILKPRYEIHARLPVSPEQTVTPDTNPTPELEEASVVLFSGAEGSGAPERQMSPTFEENNQRYAEEQRQYSRHVKAAVALVPFGLYVLLTLPIIIYAVSKLFHRRPIEGASDEDLQGLRNAVHGMLAWWVGGLYLPIGGFLVVGVAVSLFHPDDAGTAAALGAGAVALVAFVKLLISVIRLRRTSASDAFPLLRKFATLLVPAYPLLAIAFASLVGAANAQPQLLQDERVIGVFAVMAAMTLLVVPALSIAGNCALQRVSLGRWLWLALSRSLAVAASTALLLAMMMPPLSSARVGKVQGTMEQVGGDLEDRVFNMPAGMDRLIEHDSALGRGVPTVLEAPGTVGEALKEPTRIRRYFPETLLWNPELITDAAGRAQLEIPLADSITTWRIAMSAVSKRGELGSATKGLRVFQDFFVDIDFPVALTQHDVVSVPVAVFNYLDKPQTVRLEAQAGDWCELLDEPIKTIEIGAREVTSVYFRLRAQTPGRHSLTLKASGSEMADAVERTVMVSPDGKEFVQTINGYLDENLTREIVIPEDAIDGASDLLVKIYPGSFSQVVEGLDSIFQMPFGCFEQTSSVTYPNVLVLDYMRRTKQIKPEIEMKALNFINLGYQRLLSYEVAGGGFSWFGGAPAHNVLTAYGLTELSDMAKVDEVDPDVIARTRKWLYSIQEGDGSWKPSVGGIAEGAINQFQGAVLRTTAYVAWALAESSEADQQLGRALDYVVGKGADTDDAYTLALCANALAAAKRSEANVFLKRLDAMKQEKDKLVWWTSAGEGATFSRGNVLDIETTALAAYAFLKANYGADTAHKALAWLVEHKDPQGTWHSTQATVHAMRALLSGTGASGGVEGDVHVTITANGEVAKELTITPETSDVFRLISLRPMVREGKNTVALESAGKGNLAYQIVATHYLPWPEEAEKATTVPSEMTIDVAYDTTTLKTDDLLTCRVSILYNRPGSANMTIVDLGVPPGFEIVPDAFDALRQKGVIQRYAMTGRQVILYFEKIQGQEPITFAYQLKAKFPVKVKTPPSAVYQYYEPALRDEAAPVELTVLGNS